MISTRSLVKPSAAPAAAVVASPAVAPARAGEVPPPPPGFVLEAGPQGTPGPADIPPPPAGFVLEGAAEGPVSKGVALNATVNLSNAVPTLVGAPVDLARIAINAATQPNALVRNLPFVGPILGATQDISQHFGVPAIPDDTIGSSQSIRNAMDAAGIPTTNTVKPTNLSEQIAAGAGAAAGMTIGPEAALAGLAKVGVIGPRALEILQSLFGKSESVAGVGSNVVSGAAAGGGAVAAEAVAPEPLKPLAAAVGGLAGGGAGLGVSAIPRVAGAAARLIGELAAPLSAAGREQMAGRQLVEGASSPGQVVETIANAPPAELVPGSKPTTFQQTGDMGLGSMERAAMTKPGGPEAFNQRRADQNASRLGAVEDLQATGAPETVVKAVRSHIKAIDDQALKELTSATEAARGRTAALGPGAAPENAGATMRAGLESARASAKAQERALWDAVDPEGTLALPASGTRQQAASITKGMASSAKPLEGEEAAIFQVARGYGESPVAFSELTALQSRLKTAMREERITHGESPSYRRLTMLNGAIQRDLETVVAGRVAKEAREVAAGTRSPADTLSVRLSGAPQAGTAVFTPAGRKVDVEYRVVSADQPIASNLDDMQLNPNYAAELQPRNRTRAASAMQVSKMAAELQPERLGPSASAAEGAPIIGPDGMVESGNARLLAIRRAYQQNGKPAEAYGRYLRSLGYSTEGIARPVLVRVRQGEMAPAERVRFAQESNASPTLAMSASERAASDASRLDGDVLGLYRGGDVNSAENRDFVRAFLGKVADQGEEGAFVTGSGTLSVDGARRVRGALLRSAYDDAPLIEALADAGDENVQVFGKALQEIAGDVARVKQGIQSGRLVPGVDIAPPMIKAAKFVQDARKRGVSLSNAVAQRDAFTSLSDDALVLLKAAYGANLSGRMARGDFEAMARDVIAEAELQTTDARLFGEASNISEILRARNGTSSGTSGRLAADAQAARGGARENGHPQGGPGAGAPRQDGSTSSGSASVLPRPELQSNFDEAALRRLTAARAATKTRVETFDNKTLGPIRRRPGTAAPYDMPAAAVPARIFFPGQKSFEAVEAYRAAVGDGPALSELEAYAVDRLRKVALRDDGTLDPARVAAFRRGHADALRAFPALDAQFADAAAASETMTGVAAARKAALDEAQKGTVGKLIGVDDPGDVTRLVGAIFGRSDRVAQMRQLRGVLGGDKDAAEGLRKAVVDHIVDRFVSNTEAATSGRGTIKSDGFQSFVSANSAALEAAGFTEAELRVMERVAADLQQANRSIVAVKLPGQSNTAQDVLAAKAGDAPSSILVKIVAATMVSGGAGWLAGPLVGAAATLGTVGTALLSVLRQQGIAKIDDLVRDALLHPERARLLMMKAKPEKVRTIALNLAAQYRRAAVAGTGVGLSQDRASTSERGAPAVFSPRPGALPHPTVAPALPAPTAAPQQGASVIAPDMVGAAR